MSELLRVSKIGNATLLVGQDLCEDNDNSHGQLFYMFVSAISP